MPTDKQHKRIFLTGLSLRLTLFVGAMLLICTCAFLTLLLHFEKQKYRTRVHHEATRVSATIRRSIEFEMTKGKRDDVQKIVEAMSEQPALEEVRIFDKEGRIVVSNDTAKIGTTVDKQAEACYFCHEQSPPVSRVEENVDRSRIFVSAKGYRVLGKVDPIYNAPDCYNAACHFHEPEDRVLGVMDVVISLEDVDKELAGHRNRIIAFAVILFLVLSLAIAVYVHLSVHVPIHKLSEASAQVASGDLNQKVNIDRRDDMGLLANAFNKMTADLAVARDKSEEWQAGLEQQIEEATRQLQRKTQELTTIYEGISDGIALIDPQLAIRTVNHACAELFGGGADDIIGKKCCDIFLCTESSCDACPVMKAFRSGKKEHLLTSCRHNGDGAFSADIWAFPVKDEDGLTAQVVTYIKDVTAERDLDKHMRRVDKLASLGQIAAGIAHGLNTPLATIKNGIQGVFDRIHSRPATVPGETEELEKYLAIISEEILHCQRVIRDLLNIAREPEPQYEPLNLCEVVESVTTSAVVQRSKDVRLHLSLRNRTIYVRGNLSYLRQAFLNVLQNCYDAIEESGEVTVEVLEEDSHAVVRFQDTGCGIPPASQKHIFEPLYTTKEPGKGTGLGLAVTSAITKKHGGTISVESQAQRGTCVTITLPLLEKRETEIIL